MLALGGIDIIGVDCYDTIWNDSANVSNNIISSLTEIEGNLTHLAESSAAYDSSVNTALMLEEGIGNMIYCHRSDRTGGGLYEQANGEIKSSEAISEALINSGAYIANGDVLTSVMDTGTKYATITTKQNFVFDFNVKLDALMTGSDNLQLRIRSKDVSANAEAGIVGHSEGYRIHIYNYGTLFHSIFCIVASLQNKEFTFTILGRSVIYKFMSIKPGLTFILRFSRRPVFQLNI